MFTHACTLDADVFPPSAFVTRSANIYPRRGEGGRGGGASCGRMEEVVAAGEARSEIRLISAVFRLNGFSTRRE